MRTEHAPILIDGAVVEQVESFKFLGVHINNKLEWSKHTKTVVKRARHSLFPLRKLKRFGMGPQILKRFYSCNITAWYGNCSASDRKTLEGSPVIQDLYTLHLYSPIVHLIPILHYWLEPVSKHFTVILHLLYSAHVTNKL